jgi:hypothetical protein
MVLHPFAAQFLHQTEELRDYFVAHEGRKELEVKEVGTIHSVDFGLLAQRMTHANGAFYETKMIAGSFGIQVTSSGNMLDDDYSYANKNSYVEKYVNLGVYLN